MVAESLKTFGTLHAPVHSAGIFRMNPVEATPTEEFRQIMDTNLTSTYFLLKFLMPHFTSRAPAMSWPSAPSRARWGSPGDRLLRQQVGPHGHAGGLPHGGGSSGGSRSRPSCLGFTLTPAWDTHPGELPAEWLR